jgi:hypothetical protein
MPQLPRRVFLTNVNATTATATSIDLNPTQEAAMGAKSKSPRVRAAARKRAAPPAGKRTRRATAVRDFWEQTAETPEQRVDEIDCERIVHGDGGRRRPAYSDDYH